MMITIDKMLEPLRPYVIGIRYVEGLPLVDVIFKEKWLVPNAVGIKRLKGKDEPTYSMLYSEDPSINMDAILNYVLQVINLNLEKEAKDELLKQKIAELKEIFDKYALNKLSGLQFIFQNKDFQELSDESSITEHQKLDEAQIKYLEDEARGSGEDIMSRKVEKTPIVLAEFPEVKYSKTCECKEGEACPVCIDSR